jgi:hypothetical protein
LEILGTSLVGVGVVPQLGTFGSKTLNIIALIGFILVAAGKALTALFSANPVAIKATTDSLQAQVVANTNSIVTGDSGHAVRAQNVAATGKVPVVVPVAPPTLPPAQSHV